MKGGRGSSSQDLRFIADNTERKSDSRTGRKLSKVDVVVENCGGGASIVIDLTESTEVSRVFESLMEAIRIAESIVRWVSRTGWHEWFPSGVAKVSKGLFTWVSFGGRSDESN